MSRSSGTEDGNFVAMDTEEDGEAPVATAGEVDQKMGSSKHEMDPECGAKGGRTMSELPEEVLEYILSFLSPYQEHKTAALVCKQWYRLIKGTSVHVSSCNIHIMRPKKKIESCIHIDGTSAQKQKAYLSHLVACR